MSLEERVKNDLIAAMKAKEADKLNTLRMLKAAMTNVMIEKKKDVLTDDESLQIIQKQAKQRKESIENFAKAGRTDMADKEKRELAILEIYLPKQLSDAEITELAKSVIQKTGASSKGDTGKVMKELMPLVKGKADGQRVNVILGSLLT